MSNRDFFVHKDEQKYNTTKDYLDHLNFKGGDCVDRKNGHQNSVQGKDYRYKDYRKQSSSMHHSKNHFGKSSLEEECREHAEGSYSDQCEQIHRVQPGTLYKYESFYSRGDEDHSCSHVPTKIDNASLKEECKDYRKDTSYLAQFEQNNCLPAGSDTGQSKSFYSKRDEDSMPWNKYKNFDSYSFKELQNIHQTQYTEGGKQYKYYDNKYSLDDKQYEDCEKAPSHFNRSMREFHDHVEKHTHDVQVNRLTQSTDINSPPTIYPMQNVKQYEGNKPSSCFTESMLNYNPCESKKVGNYQNKQTIYLASSDGPVDINKTQAKSTYAAQDENRKQILPSMLNVKGNEDFIQSNSLLGQGKDFNVCGSRKVSISNSIFKSDYQKECLGKENSCSSGKSSYQPLLSGDINKAQASYSIQDKSAIQSLLSSVREESYELYQSTRKYNSYSAQCVQGSLLSHPTKISSSQNTISKHENYPKTNSQNTQTNNFSVCEGYQKNNTHSSRSVQSRPSQSPKINSSQNMSSMQDYPKSYSLSCKPFGFTKEDESNYSVQHKTNETIGYNSRSVYSTENDQRDIDNFGAQSCRPQSVKTISSTSMHPRQGNKQYEDYDIPYSPTSKVNIIEDCNEDRDTYCVQHTPYDENGAYALQAGNRENYDRQSSYSCQPMQGNKKYEDYDIPYSPTSKVNIIEDCNEDRDTYSVQHSPYDEIGAYALQDNNRDIDYDRQSSYSHQPMQGNKQYEDYDIPYSPTSKVNIIEDFNEDRDTYYDRQSSYSCQPMQGNKQYEDYDVPYSPTSKVNIIEDCNVDRDTYYDRQGSHSCQPMQGNKQYEDYDFPYSPTSKVNIIEDCNEDRDTYCVQDDNRDVDYDRQSSYSCHPTRMDNFVVQNRYQNQDDVKQNKNMDNKGKVIWESDKQIKENNNSTTASSFRGKYQCEDYAQQHFYSAHDIPNFGSNQPTKMNSSLVQDQDAHLSEDEDEVYIIDSKINAILESVKQVDPWSTVSGQDGNIHEDSKIRPASIQSINYDKSGVQDKYQIAYSNKVEQNFCPDISALLSKTRPGFFIIKVLQLPRRCELKDLKKLFNTDLGLKVKVSMPQRYCSRAFLQFASEGERKEALNVINGYTWKRSTLKAEVLDYPGRPRMRISDKCPSKKLKVDDEDYDSDGDLEFKLTLIPYWDVDYEEQLKIKYEAMHQVLCDLGSDLKHMYRVEKSDKNKTLAWLRKQTDKFNGMPCKLLPMRYSDDVNGWCTKCKFHVGFNHKIGRVCVGFKLSKRANYDVAPISSLEHISDQVKAAVKHFTDFVRTSRIEIYNGVKGYLQNFYVRTASNRLMLGVGIHKQETYITSELKEFFKNFVEYFTLGPGEVLKVTSMHYQVLLGRKQLSTPTSHLWGDTHIAENILGLTVKVSPNVFVEPNRIATGILYKAVRELAGPTPKSTVVYVNCGVGIGGLYLAKYSRQVFGIDMSIEAIRCSKENARINNIRNCEFMCANPETDIEKICHKAKYDVIVVIRTHSSGFSQNQSLGFNVHSFSNQSPKSEILRGETDLLQIPPSNGENFISTIRGIRKVKKIIYLAPSTYSQTYKNFIDLGGEETCEISGKPFLPTKAIPVDLSPHSADCEIVIRFERLPVEHRER